MHPSLVTAVLMMLISLGMGSFPVVSNTFTVTPSKSVSLMLIERLVTIKIESVFVQHLTPLNCIPTFILELKSSSCGSKNLLLQPTEDCSSGCNYVIAKDFRCDTTTDDWRIIYTDKPQGCNIGSTEVKLEATFACADFGDVQNECKSKLIATPPPSSIATNGLFSASLQVPSGVISPFVLNVKITSTTILPIILGSNPVTVSSAGVRASFSMRYSSGVVGSQEICFRVSGLGLSQVVLDTADVCHQIVVGVTTPTPQTAIPATAVPLTPIPQTAIPTTAVPLTPIPQTAIPTTAVPLTLVPQTAIPTTAVPLTLIPQTAIPTTAVPLTLIPQTAIPTTAVPLTPIPQTAIPTTAVPLTPIPQTAIPTTAVPLTLIPQTAIPTTAVPLTLIPQTAIPTTAVPLTLIPQTAIPTTAVPSVSQTAIPMTAVPPTQIPPTAVPPTPIPQTAIPPTTIPQTNGPLTTTPLIPQVSKTPTDVPIPLTHQPTAATPVPLTSSVESVTISIVMESSLVSQNVEKSLRTFSDSTTVGAAGGVLSAVVASPSGGSVAMLAVTMTKVGCDEHIDDSSDLPLLMNPLKWKVKNIPRAGAIIGNMFLSLIVSLFLLLVTASVTILKRCSWRQASIIVRSPSALIIGCLFFFSAILDCAADLLLFPRDALTSAVGVIGLLFVAGSLFIIWRMSHKAHFQSEIKQNEMITSSIGKYMLGSKAWISNKGTGHTERFGVVFDIYQNTAIASRGHFIFFEIGQAFPLILISLTQPSEKLMCAVRVWVMGMVFLIYTIVCLVFSPFLAPFLNHISPIFSFVVSIAMLFFGIGHLSDDYHYHWATATGNYLATAAMYIAMIRVTYETLTWFYEIQAGLRDSTLSIPLVVNDVELISNSQQSEITSQQNTPPNLSQSLRVVVLPSSLTPTNYSTRLPPRFIDHKSLRRVSTTSRTPPPRVREYDFSKIVISPFSESLLSDTKTSVNDIEDSGLQRSRRVRHL